jgi:hypothetical protein
MKSIVRKLATHLLAWSSPPVPQRVPNTITITYDRRAEKTNVKVNGNKPVVLGAECYLKIQHLLSQLHFRILNRDEQNHLKTVTMNDE